MTMAIILAAVNGSGIWLAVSSRAYLKHASLPVRMAFDLGRAVERGVRMVHGDKHREAVR